MIYTVCYNRGHRNRRPIVWSTILALSDKWLSLDTRLKDEQMIIAQMNFVNLEQVHIWFRTSADAMLLFRTTSASQISRQPLNNSGTRFLCIWVRSRNCGCLATWFCYQLIAKPGNKTAAVPWPDPYVIASCNIQSVYDRELLSRKASCHRTVILDSFLWLVCNILYFPWALLHLDNYVMPDLVTAPTIGPKHWHIVANSTNRLCMTYRLCVLQNNCRCHVHEQCRCFICTVWSGVNSK